MLAVGPQPLRADTLPQKPTVTNGAADFDYTRTNQLHVDQHSPAVRIEWDSFNIGPGQLTEFHQPDAGSIAFNIVRGEAPSSIFGTLRANGQVVLSNGSGILFAEGAILDVAGALLTTHRPTITVDTALGPDPFLDVDGDIAAIGADGEIVVISTGDGERGDKSDTLLVLPPSLSLRFTRPTTTDRTPSVHFGGEARIADQGGLGIVAPIVRVPGKIVARGGVVAMSTADSFTIDPYGDGLITFEIGSVEHADRGEIDHAGVTVAQTVLLDVGHMHSILDRTINIDGVVAAQSASIATDGTVVLGGGDVTINGVVKGDDVDIDAGTIEIAGLIDATGADRIMSPDGAAGDALADIRARIAVANQILAGGAASATAGKVRLAAAHGIDITGGINAAGGAANQSGGAIVAVAGTDLAVAGGAVVTADGQAGGGDILLTGDQTVTAAAAAVITAAASTTGDGGRIRLQAAPGAAPDAADDGAAGGRTEVAATVAADGAADGVGGTVEILGDKVGVVEAAMVTARGGAGGGTIHIGGDYQGRGTTPTATVTFVGDGTLLDASAVGSDSLGDGGEVIVWADHTTRAFGTIRATAGLQGGDGGFVEVSGKQHLAYAAAVDTSATNGANGTLLLDPNNISITNNSGGGDSDGSGDDNEFITASGGRYDTSADDSILDISLLQAALASNDVHVRTGSAGGNIRAGDIYVNARITNTSGNDLTLEAHNNIAINADIDFSGGAGNLTLIADGNTADPTGGDGIGAIINNGGKITMAGGDLLLRAGTGIGTKAQALDVVLNADTKLTAETATGGIYVDGAGTGQLEIAQARVTDASASNYIQINNDKRITVTGTVDHRGSGNIYLFAGSSPPPPGGGISDDYRLEVGDLGRVSSNSGHILLHSPTNIVIGGTTGGATLVDSTSGSISLGGSASGRVTIRRGVGSSTTGEISINSIGLYGGHVTHEAGAGAIGSSAADTITIKSIGGGDVTLAAVATGADLNIVSSGDVTLAGAVATGADLDIVSSGAITQSAALTVGGGLILRAHDGSKAITLDNAANAIDGTITINTGAVSGLFGGSGSGGAVALHNSRDIALGASTVAGSLALSGDGAITQSAALVVDTDLAVTATDGSAAVTLDNVANAIDGTITINTGTASGPGGSGPGGSGSGGAVALHNSRDIDIGTSAVAGSLTLTSDGAIINNGGMITMAGGDLVLRAGTGIGTARQLDVVLNADTRLTSETATGGIFVTGTGTGQLEIAQARATDASASNFIQIENDNRITVTGTVDHRGSGSIELRGRGVEVGDAGRVNTNSGHISLASTEANLVIGSTIGSATLVDSMSGNVFLDGQIGGGVTIRRGVGTSTTGSIIVDSSGSVTHQAGAGAIGSSAAGFIRVHSDGDITLAAVTTGDFLSIESSGDIMLGAVAAGGFLRLHSRGGDITQSAALTVGGNLSVTAIDGSTAVTLDNAANAIDGTIRINTGFRSGSGGAVALHNSRDIDLGTSLVMGSLALSGDGDITQSAALIVDGNLAVTATDGSAAITLERAANAIDGTISFNTGTTSGNGGEVRLYNSGDINLGASEVKGLLALSGSGAITQSAALNVSADLNVYLTNGSKAITLDHAANAIDGTITINTGAASWYGGSAGAVALHNSRDIDLGASAVSGSLALSGDGDITQSAALTVGAGLAVTTTDGSKAVTLDNAANAIDGTITINTGTRSGSGGVVALTNSGDIALGASEVKGLLVLSGDGAITQSAALTVGAGLAVTATDGSAAVTLDNAANAITGTISFNTGTTSGHGGTVTFKNAAAGGTVIGASTVEGHLLVDNTQAGTDLTIAANVTADGAVTLISADELVMAGGLLLDAGSGTIDINGANGVTLANLKTTDVSAGAVTIQAAGGAITQHGGDSIQLAGGTASFTADSGVGTAGTPIAIAMTGAVDVTATTNSGGIFINGSGGHALGIGSGGLSASAGDITFANTGGDVVVAPGGGITLSDATSTLTLETVTAGTVDIQESIAVAGDIVLNAAGDVRANTGSTTVSAGGAGNSITVTTASLAGLGPEAGSGRFNTAGNIAITTTQANPVIAALQDIARATAGGDVTVTHTGTGGLTLSGAAYGTQNVTLVSHGDVTFATAAFDTGSGNLAVTSGGDITQQAAADLRVGGTLMLTGTDGGKAMTLTNTANAIDGTITINTGTSSGGGGMVEITNSSATTIEASAVKGRLIVNHQGTLTLQGGITADDGFSHVSGSNAGVFLKDELATTGGAIAFTDDVTLIGNAMVDAGSADIAFAGTVDGAFDLTLDAGAGNIDFMGKVGSTAPIGTMTVVSANLVTAVDNVAVGAFIQSAGTGTTTFGSSLDTTGALGIDITTNNIDLQGAISATGGGGITLTNAGSLTVANNITADGAFVQDGAGAVTLMANITAEAGVRFDGTVSLDGAVTLSSGTGAGDITVNGTLDGTTPHADNLTLTAGTGMIDVTGVVGGGVALGEITITMAGDVTAGAAITAASLKQNSGTGTTILGDITLSTAHSGATANESIEISTGSIALTGRIDTGGWHARFSSLSGDTGLTATGQILTSGGDAVVEGSSVTMASGALINTGAGSIGITATSGDAQIARLISTIAAPAVGIQIQANGSVTDANGGTLNIDMASGWLDVSAASGTIDLDTDIAGLTAAAGDAITLREANALDIIDISLGAGTGTGLIQAGGDLTVVDNGNGALAAFRGGNSAMTLESTGGAVVVNDALTSNSGDLSLTAGGGVLRLDADITTAGGAVTTSGGIELTGDIRIATGGGAITLGDDVDAAASAATPALDLQAGTGAITVGNLGVGKALGAVTLATTGVVQVGGQVEADSLTVAAATTTLTSNINTYAGGLGIDGDTILSASITVDTHNSGDINFAGAIDGTTDYQEALVLTPGAAHSARIDGPVGATVPLAGLTITDAVDATVTGALSAGALSVQTLSGRARFADATLGGGGTTGNVSVRADAIQFGALDSTAGTAGVIDLVTVVGVGGGGIQTGAITGPAKVTLDSSATGGAILTGAITAGGSGLEITTGGGNVTTGDLNGTVAGAQALTITTGAGNLSVGSIGTVTEFGAINFTTDQGRVDVNGAVVLGDNMTVTTGGTTIAGPGADVTFHGPMIASNGSTSSPALAVYAGGGGAVEFKADIGNPNAGSPDMNALESVTVVADRITTESIASHNDQTFTSVSGTLLKGNNAGSGTLTVGGPLLLTADLVRTGGDVMIFGDINYDVSVPAGTLFDVKITLNAGNEVAIFGRLGSNRDLGSVLIEGAGDNSNTVRVTGGIAAAYNMRIQEVSTVELGDSTVGGFAFIRANDAVMLNGLTVGGNIGLPAGAGILNNDSVMRASDDNGNGVVDFAEYDPDLSLKLFVGDLPGGTVPPQNSGELTFRNVTDSGSGGTELLAVKTTGGGLTTAGLLSVSGIGSINNAVVSGQVSGSAAAITTFASGGGSGFLINGCSVGVNCTAVFVPPPIVVAQPETASISVAPPTLFEIDTEFSPRFSQPDDAWDLNFSNNGNEEIW